MKEHFGYDIEIHLIKGNEDTLTASAALEDKRIQVRPRGRNDLLVIYYVGHCYTKGFDKQYYFCVNGLCSVFHIVLKEG